MLKNKETRENLKRQLNWLLFCQKIQQQTSLIEQGVTKDEIDDRLLFIENEFQNEFKETIEFIQML